MLPRIWLRFHSVKTPATVTNALSHKQKLFLTDAVSPGSIFFLPNGTRVFNKLVSFIKLQQEHLFGFQEVITPLIYRKSLWQTSGHWDNYKDDMFQVTTRDGTKEEYGLKPMNCPGHCIMFQKLDHSYNELPIRYSDLSPLHRNEASGALSGLTRVRKFHQDDGHIFCTSDQVESEIVSCLKLVDLCYSKIFPYLLTKDCDREGYKICLSTRPEDNFIGDVEVWNHAENLLKSVLLKSGQRWEIKEGDGAFYGPKLDIMIPDHTGKEHQVGTIQLDFQLPQRFNLKYKDKDNSYKVPIMIHRAVFGSLERFMSMLMDSTNGNWPFWLNPYQACIIPVNTQKPKQLEASRSLSLLLRGVVHHSGEDIEPVKLNSFHFNVDIDERSEPVGYRIKSAIMKKYSYVIVIGDEETETGKYSVKKRDDRTNIEKLTADEILQKFKNLEKNYL